MHHQLLALATALALIAAAYAQQPDEKKKPDRSVLTPERLGEMLRDLAYEPRDISRDDQHDVYEISTERDKLKLNIQIALNAERSSITFDVRFAPLADPDAAPAAAWLKLLELSAEHGPAHFTVDDKKRIHISMPRQNLGITPGEMRRQIERFDSVVRKTEPHWKPANFTPLPKLEPLGDAGRKVLEKLTGTWIVVEEARDGKKTAADDLKKLNVTYVFVGDKCRIKTKSANEKEARLWAGGGEPAPLDFAFLSDRVVQKAILTLDGDTLTLSIAGAGQPRPDEFNGTVLTLKRQK